MEITGQCLIANPLYSYGLQRVPNMQRYDEMDAIFGSSATATVGVVIEPFARVLMLQPYPLQRDTLLAEWQFNTTPGTDTSGKWQQARDASSGLQVLEMYDATAGRSFSATSLFDTPPSASFYLNLYRGESGRGSNPSPSTCYTLVSIGDGQVGGLQIALAYGQPPILSVRNSDGSYVEVARGISIGDCESYLSNRGDRRFPLRVLSLPTEGCVVIAIGEGDESLGIRLDGYVLPSGPLTVSGMGGVCRVQCLPMRFVTIGSLETGLRDNGLAIMNAPVAQVDASIPANTTVTVEGDVEYGTSYRYALTLDATATADSSGLATATPVVRAVSVFFPGQTYNDWVPAESELNLRRVSESLVFDIGTLTYEQVVRVTVNNHAGLWTGASGYRAAFLDAGIDGDNWRRITGHIIGVDQSRNDPTRETTFILCGREHWLKRKKCGLLPPFDAWDVYAVIRFLAQRGGITDEWLTALPYTPFGRGADTPYYHLPEGTGALGAKFQFDPRTPIWEAMQQVARLVRGYLGFDVWGHLHFYPWSPEGLGGYMQAFDVIPGTFDGEPLLNQLKGTFSSRIDLSDVRSDITLGSIDPFSFLPVFSHWHNESVVTNLSDPAFLGNLDEEIEINALLFDPVTQQITGDALSSQASLPALSVGLEAFFQHRLLPLDVITVQDGFCLGGLYPFYVEGMQSDYGINEQAFFGATRLNGRWLLNG